MVFDMKKLTKNPVLNKLVKDLEVIDSDVVVKMVWMTPDCASYLKSINNINRAPSESVIDRYVGDLIVGKWELNGSAIVVGENGDLLLDGQQRLTACIRTGVSFPTLLVMNVANGAIQNIDTGKPKSDADLFKMDGYENHSLYSPTWRIACIYRNKEVLIKQGLRLRSMLLLGELPKELDIRLGFGTDLCDSVASVKAIKKSCRDDVIPLSNVSVAHLHIKRNYTEDLADAFVKKVYSSYNLKIGDPIGALRTTLIKHKVEERASTSNGVSFRLLIKAWNGFVTGSIAKQAMNVSGINKFTEFKFPDVVNIFVDEDGILQRDIVRD